MKKIHIIIAVIAAAALVAAGFMGAKLLDREPQVTLSAETVTARLNACSDLTTARLDYRGLIKYSEGEIPLLTKKSFSMIYDAHIKAGIDLSAAKVTVTADQVKVILPSPMVQEITVDSDSLEFYDEASALFNWTSKEDTVTAMQYAREDAEEKAGDSQLLSQAKAQAELVVKNLLAPVEEGAGMEYEIVFQ